MNEIHGKTEIKEEMKENFKGKYVKVYDTPIPHESFVSWFGHNGITDLATAVLNGEFLFPPIIQSDIIEFFTYLEMHDEIKEAPAVEVQSTPSNYNNFWRQGREK